MTGDVPSLLVDHARLIETFLAESVPSMCGLSDAPKAAVEPLQYALAGRGKRLRPTLTIEAAMACGGRADDALPAAAAVELVHTFSLVHDDLPAMDDDDLRRGRPTVHKQFDEAAAVLAGDALSAMAFEVLAIGYAERPNVAAATVRELARATGVVGMIGGQALDIAGENRRLDLDSLRDIHARKTGALLASACVLGGLAVAADDATIGRLRRFGQQLGLAFQIADDVLDVTATAEATGKATGKDATAGKNTYPSLVGLDEARRMADEAADAAVAELDPLGEKASGLQLLARFAARRST